MGVMDILVKDVVGRYFDKNYAIAIGISRTGVSIGMLVAAPLSQLFLNTYGWRGTILLTGGILFHILLCGALLMTVDKAKGQLNDYHVVPQDERSTATQDKLLSRMGTNLKYFYDNLNLRLLVNIRYWSIAFISCSNKFAYDTWLIYFVSQAQSNGFSLEEAASFVSVAGVGNLIAKFLQGFIVGKKILPCWGLMSICITISTVSLYASPWMANYWAMMTASFLITFTDGMLSCLNDVLTKQLIGVELLAGAFALIGFKLSVIRIFIGFLPGKSLSDFLPNIFTLILTPNTKDLTIFITLY